ncbi:MAG: hypothetical protein R3E02_02665 [Blastomonas sp.]
MKVRTFAAAMAAFAMTASPVLAQAAKQDAQTETQVTRASASEKEANEGRGGSTGIILAILAAAAIIGGVAVAAGNKDDSPASP